MHEGVSIGPRSLHARSSICPLNTFWLIVIYWRSWHRWSPHSHPLCNITQELQQARYKLQSLATCFNHACTFFPSWSQFSPKHCVSSADTPRRHVAPVARGILTSTTFRTDCTHHLHALPTRFMSTPSCHIAQIAQVLLNILKTTLPNCIQLVLTLNVTALCVDCRSGTVLAASTPTSHNILYPAPAYAVWKLPSLACAFLA